MSSIPRDFWKHFLTWKSLFSGKYQTKISPHCSADKWPEIITLRVLEEVMHWPVTHSSFAFRPWPTILQRINVKPVFFHLCLINRNTFQRINSFKILNSIKGEKRIFCCMTTETNIASSAWIWQSLLSINLELPDFSC